MPELTPQEMKEYISDQAKEIKGKVDELKIAHTDLDGYTKKIADQLKDHGKEFAETKNSFQEQVVKVGEIENTLDDLVEKMTKLPAGGGEHKTLGQLAAESDEAKSYRGGVVEIAKMEGPLFAKDITSAGASAGDLPIAYRRDGIMTEPDQSLIIRDLLTVLSISTNAVEWVQEKVFTNQAAPQNGEGTALQQSEITFEKKTSSVETVGHWIAASRQILSDAAALSTFVDMRLRYGLRHKEEDQILFGDGTNGNLLGLVPQATAFNTALSVSGDTKIDQLRRAILQVALSKFPTTGIVMNPSDWCDLELTKTNDNAYLFSNPVNPTETRLWGKRVAEALSMTEGEFLAGSFGMAATLWDRQEVTVRVAEQHDDFAIKNMVAMICDERLALTVEHPAALVTGTLAETA